MLGSYVCRQCRARLSPRIRPPRNLQGQPRATFISLRNGRSPPEPQPPKRDAPEGDIVAPEELEKYNIPVIPKEVGRPGASRYAKYAPREVRSAESAQHQGQTGRGEDGAGAPRITYTNWGRSQEDGKGTVAIALALKENDLDKAWQKFNALYTSKDCAARTNASLQEANLWGGGKVFKRLLDHIVVGFCKGDLVPVTPTQVLFRYEQLDLFTFAAESLGHTSNPNTLGFAYRDVLRDITDEILSKISGTRANGLGLDGLVMELLSVFRLLFQVRGRQNPTLDGIASDWRFLPEPEEVTALADDLTNPRSIQRRLRIFLPKLQVDPTTVFPALTLFTLLNGGYGDVRLNTSVREQGARFSEFMARLLPNSQVDLVVSHLQQHNRLYNGSPEEFRLKMVKCVQSAPVDAAIMRGSKANAEEKPVRPESEGPVSESERAAALEQYLLKRIARAVHEQTHKERLERLWNEAIRTYTMANNQVAIPATIYNAFLSGFLALRAGDRSIAVWNHMLANGVTPDVKSWTAMLSGCEKARDLNGLRSIWDKMTRSGTEPDVFAWTAFVHGLMSLRQINAGFAAMDQMGRQWFAAEEVDKKAAASGGKGKSSIATGNKPAKPSIEIINGAASAIARTPPKSMSFKQKVENIHKILKWAGNFAITPDVRTYNIMMQLYIVGRDWDTVHRLLHQMEAEGIEPDVATYTMLVSAAFENQHFSGLSEAEQTEQVTTIFSGLEEQGLKLNTYMYSATIDRLIKRYSNFSAVRAVMDHMLSRNLVPNPHIYTSLITHYFQQSPPDIESVDELWFQVMKTPGTPTDKVLFDRVIEGYASVGDIGKMMAVLTTMSKHGKLPGFDALTAVVRALIGAGDWERARSVVRDVQQGEGVAKGGITGGTHGEGHFWNVVHSLGVMDGGAEFEQEVVPETTATKRDEASSRNGNGSVGGVPL